MKNPIVCLVLAAVVSTALACGSQPPADAPRMTATERALSGVYDRFRNGLILDGAGTHIVVYGDKLHVIARDKYGDDYLFPLIMLASSDVVVDPDLIIPGMVLTIPDLQRNLEDENARETLRAFLREIARVEDDLDQPAVADGLRAKADSL